MPLKRMRDEVEMLQANLFSPDPELTFILVHTEALLRYAQDAANGVVYDTTASEDAEMITRYHRQRDASFELRRIAHDDPRARQFDRRQIP